MKKISYINLLGGNIIQEGDEIEVSGDWLTIANTDLYGREIRNVFPWADEGEIIVRRKCKVKLKLG